MKDLTNKLVGGVAAFLEGSSGWSTNIPALIEEVATNEGIVINREDANKLAKSDTFTETLAEYVKPCDSCGWWHSTDALGEGDFDGEEVCSECAESGEGEDEDA